MLKLITVLQVIGCKHVKILQYYGLVYDFWESSICALFSDRHLSMLLLLCPSLMLIFSKGMMAYYESLFMNLIKMTCLATDEM